MYWSWARLAAAAAGVTGVTAGYIVNVDRATRQGHDLGAVLANYFSLFTIVSTLLSVVALTIAAAWMRLHPDATREPLTVAAGMAMVTGPVLLLGIVYNVLLRGLPSEAALADSAGIRMMDTYAVEVLHIVLPLYLLVDLLFATRRRGLPWWSLPVMVGYPMLWLSYTMVRGSLTPDPSGRTDWWYPYPFLDPNGEGGWMSVVTYIAVMLVGLVAIGAGVIAIGRHRERRSSIPAVMAERERALHR